MQNVFVSFGSFILVSQYLQLVLGLSPLQAGLLSLPASVLAIAGPMLSPLLVQRIGTPLTVAGLLLIAALGFGVLTLVGGPLAAFTVGARLGALGLRRLGRGDADHGHDHRLGAARARRRGFGAGADRRVNWAARSASRVLGSLGTAIYRGMVTSALPAGISPELAATARDTLGGALSVASQIPDSAAAATLVLTAQDALTTALHVTSAIGAVSSVAMAVAVAVYLRPREPKCGAASVRACEPEPALSA